jgi:hypothetical protein
VEDPKLEQARSSLEKVLGNTTIDELRNSDTKRVVIKESIDDILKTFGVSV